MGEMMDKEQIFGADPENLERLLSMGAEAGEGEQEDKETRATDKDSERKKSSSVDTKASVGSLLEWPGSEIGPYKLLSVLGEGGMGMVYLAEQKAPIRRRVALKVIKPGMDSKRVIGRFEAERQALALLDHANIAQVYDAGATKDGRPYFVMEHVSGLSITEYCDRHRLDIEDRLELFIQVCEGVQHAHQKGIIHRDIKPSNILVLAERDKAIPKIIDFGVAKAIAQPLTERTVFTRDSQLLGTPEYMSPEQADMANEDIDTRSDIYSLGVVLYELLAGVLPFEAEFFHEGGLDHVREVIREQEPKTPSTRLSKLSNEESADLARRRRAQPAALRRRLRGDLDWITLKAMDKDRSRRYGSAGELAMDIQHHLNHTPVTARPPRTIYRLKKFVRRHRALVIGIAAVLIVLAGGIVVSTVLAIGQARARVEVQAIAEFLRSDLLESVSEAKAGEATVSFALDAASENLEGRFAEQPLIEAWIRQTLGWTYRLLGESSKAEQHLERAVQIYRQRYGEEHLETLGAMGTVACVYQDQGRYYDAESLWTEILRISQSAHGVEHPLVIMRGLAATYCCLGKYKEAESLYGKLLNTSQRKSGAEGGPNLPFCKCGLARVYVGQARYEEAEQLFRETLEAADWDAESRWRLLYTKDLANMYAEQGRHEEAEPLLVETVRVQRQVLGDKHVYTLESMCGLARVHTAQARYEEAEALLNEALETGRRRLREEHPAILGFVNALAVLRREQGSYDEAESLFRQALEGRQRKLGDDHPACFESMHELAVLYKVQGKYDDAERLLLDAVKGRRLKLGDEHPHTLESWNNLIELYEASGKTEKAEEWRAKLPQKEAVER